MCTTEENFVCGKKQWINCVSERCIQVTTACFYSYLSKTCCPILIFHFDSFYSFLFHFSVFIGIIRKIDYAISYVMKYRSKYFFKIPFYQPMDTYAGLVIICWSYVLYIQDNTFSVNVIPGRMGIVGLSQGLPNHLWYTWLDRLLPGKSLAVVGKKVVADQVIASPFFSSTFFVGASLLEGCSLAESVGEFRSKFLMVYLVIIHKFELELINNRLLLASNA